MSQNRNVSNRIVFLPHKAYNTIGRGDCKVAKGLYCMKNKKDGSNIGESNEVRDLAWKMFVQTGEIGYYLLYKDLQ